MDHHLNQFFSPCELLEYPYPYSAREYVQTSLFSWDGRNRNKKAKDYSE